MAAPPPTPLFSVFARFWPSATPSSPFPALHGPRLLGSTPQNSHGARLPSITHGLRPKLPVRPKLHVPAAHHRRAPLRAMRWRSATPRGSARFSRAQPPPARQLRRRKASAVGRAARRVMAVVQHGPGEEPRPRPRRRRWRRFAASCERPWRRLCRRALLREGPPQTRIASGNAAGGIFAGGDLRRGECPQESLQGGISAPTGDAPGTLKWLKTGRGSPTWRSVAHLALWRCGPLQAHRLLKEGLIAAAEAERRTAAAAAAMAARSGGKGAAALSPGCAASLCLKRCAPQRGAMGGGGVWAAEWLAMAAGERVLAPASLRRA